MNFLKIGADAQLDLPLKNPNETKIETDMPDFPTFELSEETTPAAILAWWDQLVETFSRESDLAQPKLQSLRAEIAAAKGDGEDADDRLQTETESADNCGKLGVEHRSADQLSLF